MQTFSITLFATTGVPEGIRHLEKSNWSGYGVGLIRDRTPCGKTVPWRVDYELRF